MPLLHSAIVEQPIHLDDLLRLAQSDGCGAVVIFLGTVRDVNDGRSVTGMDYEAYLPMARKELRAVALEVCTRVPDLRVCLEHRIGSLALGDVSVAIVAAHPHRSEAFNGARAIIDELKRRVPIWKREHYANGELSWVDPTRSFTEPAGEGG